MCFLAPLAEEKRGSLFAEILQAPNPGRSCEVLVDVGICRETKICFAPCFFDIFCLITVHSQ